MGEWRALGNLGPEILRTLRRSATIESAESSTRIEGAKLSDGEVEQLVGRFGKESFLSRDEQELAGYANVIESIQTAWSDLRISESILLQLHRDLLRYGNMDERHRALGNGVLQQAEGGGNVALVGVGIHGWDSSKMIFFSIDHPSRLVGVPLALGSGRKMRMILPA